MDLSLPIIYNGITAEGELALAKGILRGYQINTVQLSDITSEEYTQKRAQQDGMFAADVFLATRKVVIDGGVYGSSRGDAFDLLQGWTGAFSPRVAYHADTPNVGFLPFKFYQPTDNLSTWPLNTYPNGIPLQMFLRPMIPVHYEIINNQGEDAKRGYTIHTTTTLMARDPRRYLQTPIVMDLFQGGVGTPTFPGYRGDYFSYPIWNATITSALGSAWAAYAWQPRIDGTFIGAIVVDLSTYVGKLVLDYSGRRLVDDSGVSQGQLVGSTVFAELSAHCDEFVVTPTGKPTAFVTSSITYYEAFT